MQKDSRNLWVIVSAALTLGWASCVDATVQTERVTFRASLSTQNTFQHDSTESFDWVQWRNEVRLELKYRLLPP
ncbi:MAG: hypothetical protein HY704_03845 [Gemmatimonadetes bacterium]|nr:hypothetical protein [Gemmatimonadota bacterium]